jgi:hypothetical protein
MPFGHGAVIAYLRVSTQRQQRSGLGIEAQRTHIAAFAAAEGLHIVGEFIESETGKGADALDRRPQLAAALAAARSVKCCVVVSKLDRLSRDVAFVSGLMAQRVPFTSARIPDHPMGVTIERVVERRAVYGLIASVNRGKKIPPPPRPRSVPLVSP